MDWGGDRRIDWRRTGSATLTAGVVAVPLALGIGIGQPAAGGLAALGGYLWMASHLRGERPIAPRVALVTAALLGLAGGIGAAAGGRLWLLITMTVLWAVLQAVTDVAGGTLRMPAAMSALCLLLMAIGGGSSGWGTVRTALLIFAGATWVAVADLLRNPPGRSGGELGTRSLELSRAVRAWPRARDYAALLAVPTALAVGLAGVFRISHGAWMAVTVLRVLQQDEARTISVARGRVAGTIAGCVLAAVLLATTPRDLTAVVVLIVTVAAIQLTAPARYGLFAFFLTLVALDLSTVGTKEGWAVAVIRVGLTLAGAALAVTSGMIYDRLTRANR